MKSTSTRSDAPAPLTELDMLVSDHARRCISTDERGVDEIDAYRGGPNQARPAKEVERVIAILNELESEASK